MTKLGRRPIRGALDHQEECFFFFTPCQWDAHTGVTGDQWRTGAGVCSAPDSAKPEGVLSSKTSSGREMGVLGQIFETEGP